MARNFVRENDPNELDTLRAGVDCALVLERAGYRFDKADSTKRHLKYRNDGAIVIVTHDGKGWWDPHGTAKGDVFNLVQHLNPGMSFGKVRQELRPLVGLPAAAPPIAPRAPERPDVPIATQWANRPAIQEGSAAWAYLTGERAIPPFVVRAAIADDALREGIRGTAWFAHRDAEGQVVGADRRGPDYRGMPTGSDKTLFQFRMDGEARGPVTRVVVTEAPIDALSFAAFDRYRAGTLYTATSGGMGPGTVTALTGLLERLSGTAGARLVTATDNDEPGHRYDRQIQALAGLHDVPSGRVLPFAGLTDWNQVLQNKAGTVVPPQDTITHTAVGEQFQRFRDARAAAASTPDRPAGTEQTVRAAPEPVPASGPSLSPRP